VLSEKYARVLLPPSNCVAEAPTLCFSPSYVTIHVTKLQPGAYRLRWGCLEKLLRRTRYFPGSTLRMPALAGAEYPITDSLAVNTAIFLVLFCGTVATWMRTLVGFLFYHDPTSLPLFGTVPDRGPAPGYATARRFFRRRSSLHETSPLRGFLAGILAVSRVHKREQKSPLGWEVLR